MNKITFQAVLNISPDENVYSVRSSYRSVTQHCIGAGVTKVAPDVTRGNWQMRNGNFCGGSVCLVFCGKNVGSYSRAIIR